MGKTTDYLHRLREQGGQIFTDIQIAKGIQVMRGHNCDLRLESNPERLMLREV